MWGKKPSPPKPSFNSCAVNKHALAWQHGSQHLCPVSIKIYKQYYGGHILFDAF